jgi:prephenate dehydrogenase
MNLAVIGAGKMGRWFTRFFLKEGYNVRIIEKDKSKFPIIKEEFGIDATEDYSIIKDAEQILLTVPIDDFEEVVKSIQPYTKREHVIIDACSIKNEPVKLMHKHLKSSLTLGMHPLFGPGAKDIRGQNIILTPVKEREREFALKFRAWLEERGAHVYLMSPREHDELMSIVLCLPHFIGLLACDTLTEFKNFALAKKISGSSFKILITLAEAVASEDEEFYATLHTSVPKAGLIEKTFLRKCREWVKIIEAKDRISFAKKMKHVKMRIGEVDPEYFKSYEKMYKILDLIND